MSTPEQFEMFDPEESDPDGEEFYRNNPWIVDMLGKRGRELKAENYPRWSIYGLMHEIRFSCRKQIKQAEVAKGKPVYRINNNVIPYICRKVLDKYPDLKGFFEIRGRKALKDAA